MEISENLRITLQAYKDLHHFSTSELAAYLGLARSTVQDILAGKSNARADTIEIIAKKLGVDPAFLTMGTFEPEQIQIVLLLFNSVQRIAALPQENRFRLAEMFSEAVHLLALS